MPRSFNHQPLTQMSQFTEDFGTLKFSLSHFLPLSLLSSTPGFPPSCHYWVPGVPGASPAPGCFTSGVRGNGIHMCDWQPGVPSPPQTAHDLPPHIKAGLKVLDGWKTFTTGSRDSDSKIPRRRWVCKSLTERALAQVTWDWGRGTSYGDAELYRTGTVSGKAGCIGQPVPRRNRGGVREGASYQRKRGLCASEGSHILIPWGMLEGKIHLIVYPLGTESLSVPKETPAPPTISWVLGLRTCAGTGGGEAAWGPPSVCRHQPPQFFLFF